MKRENVYFVGIGGIGMSALARYFKHKGMRVAGYDRTQTPLTNALSQEGISVHYEDSVSLIAPEFCNPQTTLVIYTPAIAKGHSELAYFCDNGFEVIKRSRALGELSKGEYVMAVAGTHGKSSTTTMLAYFNSIAAKEDGYVGGGNAILGAISKNFGSNLVLGRGRRFAVEADEFDRSFLQLHPDVAVVTAVDPDHLDIYGSKEEFEKGFTNFTSQIKEGGSLICHRDAIFAITNTKINIYSYSLKDSSTDFYAQNLSVGDNGCYSFDVVTPSRTITGCYLSLPGEVNLENAIAAIAAMWVAGVDDDALKSAMTTFEGIKRRFDIRVNRPGKIYMDDYAHHPQELRRALESVRAMFPNKTITAIFQPHLFSRTRDFADGFARSLSLADRVVLLPIYPARELPIEGVTSSIIFDSIALDNKCQVAMSEVVELVGKDESDIVITFGAGDIDTLCDAIEKELK